MVAKSDSYLNMFYSVGSSLVLAAPTSLGIDFFLGYASRGKLKAQGLHISGDHYHDVALAPFRAESPASCTVERISATENTQ